MQHNKTTRIAMQVLCARRRMLLVGSLIAGREYSTDVVSPILVYDDLEDPQEERDRQ